MTTLKSILRALVLLALASATALTLFGTPDECSSSWLCDLLVIKALCAASAASLWLLYSEWSRTDAWISRYDRWISNESNSKL